MKLLNNDNLDLFIPCLDDIGGNIDFLSNDNLIDIHKRLHDIN